MRTRRGSAGWPRPTRHDHARREGKQWRKSRAGNARGITKPPGGRSRCRRTNAFRHERRRIERSRRCQRARWNQRQKSRTLSSQESPTILGRSRIGCKSLGTTPCREDAEAAARTSRPVESLQAGVPWHRQGTLVRVAARQRARLFPSRTVRYDGKWRTALRPPQPCGLDEARSNAPERGGFDL